MLERDQVRLSIVTALLAQSFLSEGIDEFMDAARMLADFVMATASSPAEQKPESPPVNTDWSMQANPWSNGLVHVMFHGGDDGHIWVRLMTPAHVRVCAKLLLGAADEADARQV